MPILYGAKTEILWIELTFNFEFRDSLFSLETLTQVRYSNPTIFWNLKIKYADLPSFTHLPRDFHAYFFIHAFMHALRTSKWISCIFLKKHRISIKWKYLSKFIKQQPSVSDDEQRGHSVTVQSAMHHV